MSDPLIALQNENNIKLLKEIIRKQNTSILELVCVYQDVIAKTESVNQKMTKKRLQEIVDEIDGIIRFRVKRAENYLYLPDRMLNKEE